VTYVIAYVTTTLAFFALDLIWLGLIAKTFYRDQLGSLMADKINFPIATGFYAVYTIGIVIFAVVPALKLQDWQHAMLYGALFGFFAYATYDLTNMATLRDWPVKMSLADMAWGTVLTSSTATIGFLVTRALTS